MSDITMQNYYEIETEVPANHQLHLDLPRDIPAGKVKIAIIYDQPESQNSEANNWLDVLGAGKAHSRFNSTEDVNHFITEQRETWEFND